MSAALPGRDHEGAPTPLWAAKGEETRAASVGQTSRSAADLQVGLANATFHGAKLRTAMNGSVPARPSGAAACAPHGRRRAVAFKPTPSTITKGICQ
jgi:hypothetical protein